MTDNRTINISETLRLHTLWLAGDPAGVRANLSSANLSYANLHFADLSSANLSSADLSDADLSYANLSSANLSYANGLPIAADAQQRLRAVASHVLARPQILQMGSWHNECGTTHCLAGWAIHQAGTLGEVLEKLYGPYMAGLLLLGVDAAEHFYDGTDETIEWLQSVAQEAA
jgi:hypothetical protein